MGVLSNQVAQQSVKLCNVGSNPTIPTVYDSKVVEGTGCDSVKSEFKSRRTPNGVFIVSLSKSKN